MIKKIICLFITTIFLLPIPMTALAAGNPEPAFSGTRNVVFTADQSDLNNFINGGRPAFDIILRKSVPSWVSFDLSAAGRDINLTIRFDFTSFEDYKEKLGALLTYKPSLVYSTDKGMYLLESYSAIDLLTFTRSSLEAEGLSAEKSLSEIFKTTTNALYVNGEEYEGSQRISVRPDNKDPIKFDSLDISTVGKEDGSFSRKIDARVTKGEASDIAAITDRFQQIGETEAVSGTEIKVAFDAVDKEELTSKTMECLDTAASIAEEQSYKDDTTVTVVRTETLDWDTVLRDKDSRFSYSLECPSYYKNITRVGEKTSAYEQTVKVNSRDALKYAYERGFQFSDIKIATDFSNLFGKKSRTITFSAPSNIAAAYHDIIKSQLETRLIPGTVLNIYDDIGSRRYELTYSSWREKDLEKFTRSILNSSYTLHMNEKWIPFTRNNIKESFSVDGALADMAPINEFTAVYQFNKLSWMTAKTKASGAYSAANHAIQFTLSNGEAIHIDYTQFNIPRNTLFLLIVVLIIIFVFRVIRKCKRGISTLKEKARIKNENKVGNKAAYCPWCGIKVQKGDKFCPGCGKRLE